MKPRESITSIVPYSPGRLKPGADKLASNENPLGPSPKALEAISKEMLKANLYPDAGSVALKAKLAEFHGLQPENFVTGNGSDEIIQFAAWACVDAGQEGITSEHTFSEYTFAVKLAGGVMRHAPMNDGRFSLDTILSLINEKTRIIYLCNPNNPTGRYFSQVELEAFLSKVPDSILVVSDEAYREYVTAKDFPDTKGLLKKYPNLLILRTFSKIYGLAGLRVGYGIARPELIRWLEKTREPFNVNLIAQAAAIAALGDTAFVEETRKLNASSILWFNEELEKLGLKFYHTQTNFIAFDAKRDSMEMFETLMDMGTTIRPLKSFDLPTWLRFSTGLPKQNEAFIRSLAQALERVKPVK